MPHFFHAAGDEGGSGGGSDEDIGGGCTRGVDDNIGKNSGGMKASHTSYSGPNCRRNRSENPYSVTGIGKRTTEATYGIAAMQQVIQVAAKLIIAAAITSTRKNNI